MREKNLVVIGGGASGFFCAIHAASLTENLKVTILEKQSKVLQKVKVSGGGRCNVTHQYMLSSQFIKNYPRGKNLLKKSLQNLSSEATMNWFREKGVDLKTEDDGRVFPTSNQSQSIIDCLLHACEENNIDVKLKHEVISIIPTNGSFALQLKTGSTIVANYVMLACGGFQTQLQYDWLKNLGHTIVNPVPSLFTFNIPNHPLRELMGISIENAIVKVNETSLVDQGALLITHWGFSGPAVLRLSAWGAKLLSEEKYNFSISINWLGKPEHEIRSEWNTIRNTLKGQLIGSKNPFELPQRLWLYLIASVKINEQIKWSELPSKQQNQLIHALSASTYIVIGKTTFKEEFVTCGGIALEEVDTQTMESKLHSNLFFGGEILDVDGITGGFNFQHAWASGYSAALAIAQKNKI